MTSDSGSTRFGEERPRTSPARPRAWVWPLMAGLSVLAVAAAIALVNRRTPAAPPIRTQLTRLSPDDEYSYLAPAISRDGQLVAYSSNRSGKWEVWLQRLGGEPSKQLTRSDGGAGSPMFFPDGKIILYAAVSPSLDETALEIIPASGGESRKLWSGKIATSPVDLRGPALSPDGSLVAFIEQADRRDRLMVMSTASDRPRPVPGFDRLQLWPRGSRIPVWTSDGRHLLFLALSESDRTNWEWFAVPVDGGSPVELTAGATLRRGGFDAVSPGAMLEDRVLFWGAFSRPHVFDVALSPQALKVSGTARQLTYGTGRADPTSISAAGVVAIERAVTSIDYYALPLDRSTGQASGPIRRLTRNGLGAPVFDVGGDPSLAYVVTWENSDSGLAARSQRLRLDTGVATPFGPLDADRTGTSTVSRDGRLIAHSRPAGTTYSVSVSEIDNPTAAERLLCAGCGRAQGFSPDARYILLQPEASSQPNVRKKTSVHLLDVEAGVDKPWLVDATDFLDVRGLTGEKGEWVVVAATTPGAKTHAARTYLVPWRTDAVPRSEWIEVAGDNLKFSPAANFAYYLEGGRLMAIHFDPKTRHVSAPTEVRPPEGSHSVLGPDDSWVVRGPGIVFSPTDIKSSIWLLNLAKDRGR